MKRRTTIWALLLTVLPLVAKDLPLTITSDPPGATVTWNGNEVGVTPFVKKFPGGYFHETQWVTSTVLRTPIRIGLRKPGYEPLEFDIANGPYERRNLNGVYFGQFWIIAAQQFTRVLRPVSPPSETAAIDRIREGRYVPMPPAQPAATGGTMPIIEIVNGTSWPIHVYFRGPVGRSLLVDPGGSATVGLPPGSYEEAAEAAGSNILPYYGQHVQNDGTAYRLMFVVRPQN